MKKKYTKRQITEAIAYWEKQLRAGNYINESVEGMTRIKMSKIKQELEASIGKMPDRFAFRNTGSFLFIDDIEKSRFGLEIKYNFYGKISHYTESGGHWDYGKISVGRFKDLLNGSRDIFGQYSDRDVYVITIPEDASLSDFKKCLANFLNTKHATKGVDDAVIAEVFDMVKGHSIADVKLSQIFHTGAVIQSNVNHAHYRQDKWLEDRKFKIAFLKGMKDTFPCRYDGNLEYGQVLAWMCRACGCKTLSELYDLLVSSEKEECQGTQTAVDDWDEFYASEQDAVDLGSFLDSLVQRFDGFVEQHDDEDGVCLVDDGDLESWIEDTSREIIDDAWQNFDYRDCLTYKGHGDVYY